MQQQITRKMFQRSCSVQLLRRCSRVSMAQHAILRATKDLADDFKLLTDSELTRVIGVYNHSLPTFYKQKELLRSVPDFAFHSIFQDLSYLEREGWLDHIIEVANHKRISESEVQAEVEDEVEDIQQVKETKLNQSLPNAIFLWHRKSQTDLYNSMKMLDVLKFGRPLIIDCGYEYSMANREVGSYVRQLYRCISTNKRYQSPFHLHFCNLSDDSVVYQECGSLSEIPINKHLVTTTTGCYTELFDKKDLIMLSPDAPLYMEEFDPKKIYIIGGIVDLSQYEPLTYIKAKKMGIETRKLPLDIYLNWLGGNNKRLTLPSMVDLVDQLSRNVDWKTALESVIPDRMLLRAQKELQNAQKLRGKSDLYRQSIKDKNKSLVKRDLMVDFRKVQKGKMPLTTWMRKKTRAKEYGGCDIDVQNDP